jgi:hypothetical protein
MRVSLTPLNGYSLLVAAVPVKATIENDHRWLTFTVPNSVPPSEEVKILLFDGDQPAVSSLVIGPLEFVQVSPTVATRGEEIVLTIHPAGVSLGDAKLLFNSVNSSVAATSAAAPSSPLQVVAQDKLNAIVPEDIPTGAVSLQIVSKNGGQSSPYNQFRVGWRRLWNCAPKVERGPTYMIYGASRDSIKSENIA